MKSLALRLGRNVSWLFAGQVFSKLALLGIVAFLGRGIGAASVGTFTVAISVVLVAIPLLAVGQVEVLIRETARRPEAARPLLARARRHQRWPLAAGLVVALVWLSFVEDPVLRATFLALVPYAWFRVEILIRGAVFKGLDRMDVEVRARVIESVIALALVALAVLSGAPTWSSGAALSVGAGAAFSWIATRHSQLPVPSGAAPVRLPLAESLPFLGLGVLLQLLLRFDVFLLAAFGAAAAALGHYGAAAALVWGAFGLPQLLAVAIYPTASRVAATGRPPLHSALLATAAGLGLGLLVTAFVWPLRGFLVSLLFGPEFAPAEPVLGLLILAFPGASLSMVLGIVVAAWNRQRWGLVLLTVVCLVAAILAWLWIPRAGLLGAAGAAVVAHSLAGIGNFVIAAWPGRGHNDRKEEPTVEMRTHG